MMTSLDENGTRISGILGLFLSISPMVIRKDLELLASHAGVWRRQEAAFEKRVNYDAAGMAQSFHRRLLLGINLHRSSILPREVVIFTITSAAHAVAELACSAASGRGQLLELSQAIARLEEHGDCDHNAAEVRLSDSLIERVHDSIFIEVLTRYGLSGIAELFENHRPDYDITCEVGRRLISGNPVTFQEHQKIVSYFRNLHGSAWAEELVARLKANRLLPS